MAKSAYTSLVGDHELTDTAHLNPQGETRDEPVKRSLSSRSKKEVAKIRWLPWLVFAFAVNIFFFLSMIYAVIDIKRYGEDNIRFFLTAWIIFLVPSMIAAVLIMTPFPSSLRRFRHRWSDKEPHPSFLPAVNFVSAMFCCLSVAFYLYFVAAPQYKNAIWTSEIHYQAHLPIPAVAIIFWDDRTAPYNIGQTQYKSGQFPTCQLSNVTARNIYEYDCSHLVQTTTVAGYTAQVFDPTNLPIERNSFKDLQSTLNILTYVNYDSRLVNTSITSPSQFSMAAIFFDPRMDLNTVSDCGLLGMATLPSFATTTADIELTTTHDAFNILDDATRAKSCIGLHDRLLADERNPYQSWSYSLNAMRVRDTDVCDVAKGGASAYCKSVVSISYSTQMMTKAWSGPGISKLDIWINAGSILGGVQFFFWFLTLFSSY